MEDDRDTCSVCGQRFRWDDAIGTSGDHLVHARCLPRTPRFAKDEDVDDLDDDSDSDDVIGPPKPPLR